MQDNLDSFFANTHEVENQPTPLENYNLYLSDTALSEWVNIYQAQWAQPELADTGLWAGSSAAIESGFLANSHKPDLVTHDRYGRRLDEVRFHPSYHELMSSAMARGIHSQPWLDPKPGAQVARAAKFYMQTQVEAAHLCPVTMTFASIPVIRKQPEIAEFWEPLITASDYDSRNCSHTEKQSVTLGMAMTEKQGGSDVRTNSTQAYAQAGTSGVYELVGHKFFVSAPMSDAFLTLAQTPEGLSCFLLPRWKNTHEKNAVQIQRLKNKMGNVANATAEVELRGAQAWLIGEPGRGIANILEMVALTRFDCMIGSTAGMRQAVVQAYYHCSHRKAFGRKLIDQPLMQNVLADLIIEWEAALALTMRVAHAMDMRNSNDHENNLARTVTPLGKYWICKRTPGHAYEAMECLGGSGVMEDSIMPRLFRESPINATWEGSGNVQCLDILRVMQKGSEAIDAFVTELRAGRGGNRLLDKYIRELETELCNPEEMEFRARSLVEKMALALQGTLLVSQGNTAVADAFCASRLGDNQSGYLYGNLPRSISTDTVLSRISIQGLR